MLLSKHQLSVHSYRPIILIKFFTMGLSYLLSKLLLFYNLEAA